MDPHRYNKTLRVDRAEVFRRMPPKPAVRRSSIWERVVAGGLAAACVVAFAFRDSHNEPNYVPSLAPGHVHGTIDQTAAELCPNEDRENVVAWILDKNGIPPEQIGLLQEGQRIVVPIC